MKRSALLALLFLTSVAAHAGTDTSKLVVIDSADYGDTNYMMRIEEIHRDAKTSTLRLTCNKLAASVGSSMFIMRGFYEVAKARDAQYFLNLKEWDDAEGGRLYIAGFTDKEDVDIRAEFGDEFDPKDDVGRPRLVIRTSMYDLLWGVHHKDIEQETGAYP